MRKAVELLGILTVLLLALAACQTVQTTQSGVVGVERRQTMMLSPATVNRSAEKAYQQVLAEAAKKRQLDVDPATVERVRRISARLVAQVSVFRADAPGWKWETHVITSPDVNAWCMPGGKMAVYTGLIERLKTSDDELAAVMGHEIAHALREHGRERASQAALQSVLLGIGGALLGAGESAMDFSQTILDVTFNLPNSRTHETEADRIGVELSARAGFDPRAATTLWEKMGKLGGRTPQFLSTHPSPETRQKDLAEYARRVMPFYEQSRRR